MNIENTRYFILNWISKEKEQHRNGRSNKTKKQNNSKEKKNIPEWINIKKNERTRILLSNERDSVVQTEKKLRVQEKTRYSRQKRTRTNYKGMSWR